MQAIVQDNYGPGKGLELREIERPSIGEHEVLVRVRAAGVNPADWAVMSGLPYIARPVYGLRRPKIGVRGTDVAGLVAAAERTGLVVTVEEHSVIGGLGGAVAECLSEHRPTRVHRIGIADHYTESASDQELLEMVGLSAERVADRVRDLLAGETRVTRRQ